MFSEKRHSMVVRRLEDIRGNHTFSTFAFCICIFAHTFLSNSLFPYAGFMAVQLRDLSEESAGIPGGILCSAFLLARALSSYHWGKLADVYGRKFAIISSFGLCSIFSLLFGFARSWKWAVLSRFLCGFSGGITGVMCTAISEISHDDPELETKGFGLFAGRWIWGLMVAPAIGGMLAEPFEQYPILLQFINKESWIYTELTSVPFALPNIFGALLCWTSMVLVAVACSETLSNPHLREAKTYFLCDLLHFVRINMLHRPWNACIRLLSFLPFFSHNCHNNQICSITTEATNTFPPIAETSTELATTKPRKDLTAEVEDSNLEDSYSQQEEMVILSCIDFPGLLQWQNETNADAVRAAIIVPDTQSRSAVFNEETHLLLSDIKNRKDYQGLQSPPSFGDSSKDEHHGLTPATIRTIWANKACREHLLVFWIYGFVTVLVDGAFPLYCMSNDGGLGISEARVGAILTFAGTIVNFFQFRVYLFLLNRLGLKSSMVLGSLLSTLLLAFIPLSVLLNEDKRISEGEQLTIQAFFFLVAVLASSRVLSASVESSLLVSMHRTVLPTDKSMMNSLSALFASLGRAFGPLFAGSLVQHCFSLFSRTVGGFIIWISLALSGVLSGTILMILLA